MKTYTEIESKRKQSDFKWLNDYTNNGVIEWFIIQSIVNSKSIKVINQFFGFDNKIKTVKSLCQYMYDKITNNVISKQDLVDYININYVNEDPNVVSEELQSFESFEWGGDYNGSLEKSLVKKYIKEEKNIQNNIQSIQEEAVNYLMASKYNYLSSKMVESLIFNHPSVTPTINKIKDVDFFTANTFWDLKQTILPKGFISLMNKNGINELSKIIEMVKNDPSILMKWLYENQGEMRFSSENRLFVVYVNSQNHNESWKLKSDIKNISEVVNNNLNNGLQSNVIDFNFKGKKYTSKSSLILISNG